MEPGTAVFLTFSHTALAGQVSFAFAPDRIHKNERFSAPLLSPQYWLGRSILILGAKQEPFPHTQVASCIGIKSGRNHDQSVPPSISNIQHFPHVIVSHKKACPVKSKPAVLAVCELKKRLSGVLIRVAECFGEVVCQRRSAAQATGLSVDDLVTCCN